MAQVEESIHGGMDTAVLERMVKIMSYMRGTGSKPGKLRRKDKLRMLQVRLWLPHDLLASFGVFKGTAWLIGKSALSSHPIQGFNKGCKQVW